MNQSAPRYDVVAIGNAIVDVISRADEDFIAAQGMAKGSMQLIDADQATSLYDAMGPGMEVSGGSAANTLAGLAMLDAKCGFIGQVADDQLGQVFAHDIKAGGIAFTTEARQGHPPTARCLILVTPDAQRTMNTFLGASQYLPAAALDEAMIADAAILYLEGYLWDPAEPRAAMLRAIELSKQAGRKVAFTLSDAFVIDRHRDDFLAMIDEGAIDILFANEVEICSLQQTQDFEAAVATTAAKVPSLVVTRSEKGAIALVDGKRYETRAEPIAEIVDTTGAGDLFAAGFLAGVSQGKTPSDCLIMGSVCAKEIIGHVGARSQADLKALVAARLG